MLLSRELPSCSVPLSSSPLPSPQPPSRQALLLRTFEGELLFSEGFGVWVWNVLAPASTQSCPRGRPGAWEQDRGGCEAPLVGHFRNFHPSEMLSPGRERKVELSLSLTPSLLRPVSSAVGWRALTQLRPPCPGQPGSCGAQSAWWGLYPQRLTCFPCGCSSSLTGNTQFGGRRAPGSEAWLPCHLTGRPPWEVRVGTGRDSRPGRGTDHTLGRRGPGAGLVG